MTARKLFVGLGLSIALVACSKNGSENSGNKANQPPSTVKEGGSQGGQPLSDGYQLVVQNCDTGRHDFTAATADELKRQLCEALQDDKLNPPCTEPLRKEHFAKKCSGMTWTKAPAEITPASVPSSTQGPANADELREFMREQKVRNALNFVVPLDFVVAPNVSGHLEHVMKLFAEDIMTCGLGYFGPKCFEYITRAATYGGTVDKESGSYVFYSELEFNDSGMTLALKFTVDDAEAGVTPKKVEIFNVEKPRKDESITEFLSDSSKVSPLLTFNLAPDFDKAAWERLEKATDVRELYHFSKALLDLSAGGAQEKSTRTRLAGFLTKRRSALVESKDVSYQQETLLLMIDELPIKKKTVLQLSEELLASEQAESVSQIASTLILSAKPHRLDLKPAVVKALSHGHSQIRRRAIVALSKVRKTAEEESQMIGRIADGDHDVRQAAIALSQKVSVSEAHLPAAKELASSPEWAVRIQGVNLLGRINSNESIQDLIVGLADGNEDVRKEVVSQLSAKTLDSEHVPALATHLGSSDSWVRIEAAKLLGLINSDEATIALIRQMTDEVPLVMDTVLAELLKKTLNGSHLDLLVGHLKSERTSVRRDAVKLIARIQGQTATNALIDQIGDQAPEVRRVIKDRLASRSLTVFSVPKLKEKLNSEDADVRKTAAALLGKIKSPVASAALNSRLAVETDQEVRNQILVSVQALNN